MATNDEETTALPPGKWIRAEDFAETIGNAIAQGIAQAQGPKKVTFGQYARTPHSSFNKDRVKLTRQSYQNGRVQQEERLTSKEISLLNRLTHSGRYLDRQVEVIVNTEGADATVDIRFNTKTPEQRLELKGLARNFEDMLQQIVVLQEAEDAEVAERELERQTAPTRRHFGESKASKEAREKAGVS